VKIKRGSTSVRRLIFIADSSSTTGAGLANLVFNTASLVGYYFAGDLSNEVSITLATATLGTWASGGFIAVDNTNMPGWYEIGIPDAALDGGNEVAIQLRGAANMVPVNIYIELDAFDYQTATQPVNVTQISGDSVAADNAEAFFDGTGYAGTGNVIPTVTTLTNLPTIPANWLTAAGLAADAVTEIQSGLATATNVSDAQTAIITQVDANETKIDAVKAKTDNLPSDPADQSAVEAAITAATSPLATAANLATVAGYLDTEIADILADTNELQAAWADGGRLDLILDARASQTSVDDLPTNAELATALGTADDAVLAAIATVQADTDNIQTRLPAALESGRIAAALDSAATAALVDLIWDEPLTGATHNVATSSGKRLRQSTAFQQIDSTVIDASATTTTFVTGLDSAVDDFYNDSMLVFTDGALAGQVRSIVDYVGATKTIVLEEPLTSAPVNGVAFTIVSLHIHPVSQIQSGLATSTALAAESSKITNIENASGYLLAVLAGACADPQTASETYAITVFGSTFTVDMAGQTSSGTRTAPTLTKS
jgi:hypothetical protein